MFSVSSVFFFGVHNQLNVCLLLSHSWCWFLLFSSISCYFVCSYSTRYYQTWTKNNQTVPLKLSSFANFWQFLIGNFCCCSCPQTSATYEKWLVNPQSPGWEITGSVHLIAFAGFIFLGKIVLLLFRSQLFKFHSNLPCLFLFILILVSYFYLLVFNFF